jgi:hypothetical protein
LFALGERATNTTLGKPIAIKGCGIDVFHASIERCVNNGLAFSIRPSLKQIAQSG